jgi:hypothetical protein
VIAVPPLEGATHEIDAVVSPAKVWRGVAGAAGGPNGVTEIIEENEVASPVPVAPTRKLYSAPPVRPVTSTGDVSAVPGVSSVHVAAVASLYHTECGTDAVEFVHRRLTLYGEAVPATAVGAGGGRAEEIVLEAPEHPAALQAFTVSA